ncbi:2-hydroxyacid dehydrogenase [Glutamicibacter protophormiae]|uniref:2-hydroxyacid dehydrogenase n=1 Tax=Glutamicibacter protophormiae TaxID=37930 RepID=UPI002A8346FC|nr:2-hydroxyacid dehydrogenase [Glutamicibacter protophormiae]WPR65415.1 2-hydroxyacid dehydrogenase [Glutamicibacter protophormiae]WPR68913.1 2-hydroxyacid dehydrogenase [Glutamicibacter protophormiae]
MTLRVLVPWQRLVDALQIPRIEPILWHINDDPEDAPEAEVLVTERPSNPERRTRVARIKGLQHVHLLSIGYEWVLDHLPQHATLTNSRGAVEDATAEHCLALILASLRELPKALEQQREQRWERIWTSSLHGSVVLLLGAGGVGSAIAERLAPFRPAQVITVASKSRTLDDGTVVHGINAIETLLPQADVVIVALPHTARTEKLVNAGFLASLRDGALLVNVGRGPIVDTEALLQKLDKGRLRAALDVTDPEPLPSGHPLWTAPNCVVTPHMAGDTGEFLKLVSELAVRQVRGLLAGDEPFNIVVDRG